MKWIAIVLAFIVTAPMKADTLPIASSGFAVATISRFELRRLYFMKDRWAEGVGLVTLFQRPAHSAEHRQFIRETLGLTPATYFKELDLVINSGRGSTVTVVASDDDMVEKVTAKDDAIGYIDVDTLITTLGSSTKILKVTD